MLHATMYVLLGLYMTDAKYQRYERIEIEIFVSLAVYLVDSFKTCFCCQDLVLFFIVKCLCVQILMSSVFYEM